MALVGGSVLGPIVGGTIVDSYLGWRWTEFTGILQVLMLALDVIFLDETYPPALLVHKARRLRITTGNRALHAHHKETDYRFKDMTDKYLFRLFRLLVTPICFFVALYALRSALNYLVDTFTWFSASAVAVNIFLRCIFSGTFPLFATILYHCMGVPWGPSLLGFVATALIPIPFVLYVYGPGIRVRGKWSQASVHGH
ncbi:hypothetical protein PENARI_c020G01626 [Penicillium arizonense]|uniref:Major facilitator superfamily (MFS) profile domain-containing protein n=1 Tax=Penicillium arizonense TaxID=1835702 RepID=A0A1F5L8V9_PENAI|nr:hypothetical protein PENARI_c020G01626 [Penicillium arizonense]OGE49645.1 hypothetical protein PENARI_c020G01626 [Penicillium arizonense]